ncbi:MAG: hypothetical protein V4750_02700 [Pseudomonadota bacterium]
MDEDLEQMLEGIKDAVPATEGGGDVVNAPAPKADAAPETPAAAAPSPWDPKPWEFDHNGKKVFPDSQDKARTWMSQGYNYSQRMAEMNARKRELDGQADRYKGFDRYSEIDTFAKSNPQWWEHVEKSWTERAAQPAADGGALDPAFQAALAPLQQELSQLRQWREEQAQQAAQVDEQRQDEALSKDIESTRGSHPKIDFDAVDESGKTLELRILEHAAELGTSSFRAAARDYLHDQLLESATAERLAADAKAPQQQRAAGVLGKSPAPKKGATPAPSLKGRSWDEARDMALAEYGVQ